MTHPTQESLDEAARKAGYRDWNDAQEYADGDISEKASIIAVATTLDEFAPIVEDSIYLAEHEAVMASIKIGGWLSAALDDPAVCDAMKADINRWFSAGFLYLDEVRGMIEADRAAVEAATIAKVVAWLREESFDSDADQFAYRIEAGEWGKTGAK